MIFGDNLVSLLNPTTALVAGALASLHCVGMCGPMSCAIVGSGKAKSNILPHGFYHLGRLVSYGLLGALAGAVGSSAVSWFSQNPARFAPWAFAFFFLMLALGLDGYVTRWQARNGYGRTLLKKAYLFSGNMRGLALGFATPLIPCGPLYVILWATTMAGSAADGAIVMTAYGFGTVPMLFVAQAGWSWLSLKSKPDSLLRWKRAFAFAAFGVICMRAFMDTDAQSVLSWDSFCKSVGL